MARWMERNETEGCAQLTDTNTKNVIVSPLPAEIPLYHILNARITFSNLNGCEEGTGGRADNEVVVEGDGQRDPPMTDTPSPGSDSSSVSSSSSTSENIPPIHTVSSFLTSSSSADKNHKQRLSNFIFCRFISDKPFYKSPLIFTAEPEPYFSSQTEFTAA